MDILFSQVLVATFLMLLGGSSAYLMGRLTRVSDDHAETRRALAVALNDIDHLKQKALTHTTHIDTLFEMKNAMAAMQMEVKSLSETLPQMMGVMQQLVGIVVRRAA